MLLLEKLARFNFAYFCLPPIKPKFPSCQNYLMHVLVFGFFSALFWDIDLKFDILICHKENLMINFYTNYYPLLKIIFHGFLCYPLTDLLEIWFYDFVMRLYRSISTFVTFDLAFQELVHFACSIEVAAWTVDQKIHVQFPAYPHWMWVLWRQGG